MTTPILADSVDSATSQTALSSISFKPFNEGNGRAYGWLIWWSDRAFDEPIRVINYNRNDTTWRERIDIQDDQTLTPYTAQSFLLAMHIATILLGSLTLKNEADRAVAATKGGIK